MALAGLRSRGHPAALAVIARAVSDERPPHALLISGPAGVGKTTLALDLAAGLLCQDPDPAARPCRACAACRKLDHGNHPDVHRLAPAGPGDQIRLPQVQRLIADLSLLPMEGRWRVAIIEDAHRLNPDAQNALLKTLEEPVGAACIVLAAEDLSALLPTVVSRCARIRLGPVDAGVIAGLIVERGLADASRAATIARTAGGRPGVALALAGEPDAIIAGGRLARALLDLALADRRTRLAAVPDLLADAVTADVAVQPGGGSRRPATTGDRRRPAPAERRRAVTLVLSAWRDVGRDLAIVSRGGEARIRHLDLLEDLRAVARLIDEAELLRFLERLDGVIAAIEAYANPELALDVMLLAWPRARRVA